MPFDESNISSESFKLAHTEPVLTADKNYRIVREEDSLNIKSSLMIGLVLAILFLLMSGWSSMIEPMVLYGYSNQNVFVCTHVVRSLECTADGYK